MPMQSNILTAYIEKKLCRLKDHNTVLKFRNHITNNKATQ